MTKGYFKEQDGNIAWYGYRAVQNSSGNWTNAGFSIPSSAAMASGKGDDCGGEYVIQSRFLFIQQSYKIGNLTLQTQLDDADDKFSPDYAGVTQMGLQFSNLSVKDSFENTPVFYFKSIVKNSEGNGVWAPAYNMTLHTVQFNGNTWYTFRQTYNLDIKTYRIIYNAAGNKVYDESVELPTKENGGKIAVPYNSKTPVTLTVKPSSGYEVKDVKAGGISKRKVTEISLSEIKSDQTVEIEFKKEAQKEPAAPVVSDVKISGIAMISRELTASFGYSDKNDDPMTEAVYSWEVSADGKTGWSAVGENKNTFTLTENEVGKFVRVGVVAKNDAAELNTSGDPVYSSAFGPISAMKTAPWIKESSAKIAGSGNVGGGLTAEYTYEYDSASGDVEGKTEFVWEISDSENGAYTPIDGASAKVYCPTAEQTGKYIRVRITPVDKNEISGAEAVTAGIQVTDTAIEYFVATNGDDKNPGTMEKPFATLGDTSDLKNNGKLFSNYDRYMAGSEEKTNLQYSYKVCQIPTSDRVISRNSVQSTMSAIGYKCQNPIRALKLVQLLHEDEYLLNLLCYGIEGRDYTKDPSNPKRMIRDTDSYYISEFLIGSQFFAYLAPAYSDDVWEKAKKENENAKIDPNIGFAFDRKPVESELSNISAVSGEYNGLEKGLYDNYEEMFAEMQEKLELAGSKIVKDEIERQYKDWKDNK